MPLWPQRLYYAAIIATCQVNEASLPLDTLQLSRSNVNSVVRSYLSPTPVGVGVGTSLIWAVDQTLLPGESGYARLDQRLYSLRESHTLLTAAIKSQTMPFFLGSRPNKPGVSQFYPTQTSPSKQTTHAQL